MFLEGSLKETAFSFSFFLKWHIGCRTHYIAFLRLERFLFYFWFIHESQRNFYWNTIIFLTASDDYFRALEVVQHAELCRRKGRFIWLPAAVGLLKEQVELKSWRKYVAGGSFPNISLFFLEVSIRINIYHIFHCTFQIQLFKKSAFILRNKCLWWEKNSFRVRICRICRILDLPKAYRLEQGIGHFRTLVSCMWREITIYILNFYKDDMIEHIFEFIIVFKTLGRY